MVEKGNGTKGMKTLKLVIGIMAAVLILLVVFSVYLGGVLLSGGFVSDSVSDEERASIHLNLAVIYNSKGEINKTIREMEKAIQICPECDLPYVVLGDFYFQMGEFNRSLENYEKALELKKDPEYYFDIGNVYWRMGMTEEALEQYKKVVELKPDASNAYLNIANILFDLGRLPESKVYYDKALEIDYYNSNVHNDIGVYYEEIGEMEKAREEYELALQINPNNMVAKGNLERFGRG